MRDSFISDDGIGDIDRQERITSRLSEMDDNFVDFASVSAQVEIREILESIR